MKTQFDKIYVLSLIVNHDRQESIKYQMNELGLDFEFIYGIDFYNLSNDATNSTIIYPNVFNNNANNTASNYGCTMTHYQAVLQAYELGYNNVLIMEDDACFVKDKNLIEHYLNNFPKEADFITFDPRFLGDLKNNEQQTFLELLKKCNNDYVFLPNTYKYLCGGMMYGLMNRDTMKLYLDNQRKSFYMSDHVLGFFRNPTVKRYVCKNCLCIDQYNIITYFQSAFIFYENIYNKINKLDVNNFYHPEKLHIFSR